MSRQFVAVAVVLAALAVFIVAPARSQQIVNHLPGSGSGQWGQHAFISWSGSVDDTVDVYIQGGRVWEQVQSGKGVVGADARVSDSLPQSRVQVSLTRVRGRGQVWIVQQPHRRNGYTAIVRIQDAPPGRGNYHFRLVW